MIKIRNFDEPLVTGDRIGENSIIYDGELFRFCENICEKANKYVNKFCTESSLNRVKQHNDRGLMMISACRSFEAENPNSIATEQDIIEQDKVNKANTKKLASDIRSHGLGYIRTVGGYGEETEDGVVDVVEASFLVPYMPEKMSWDEFESVARKLCAKYNQDSVLIKKPDSDEYSYVDRNGSVLDTFNGFKEDNLAQYFSYLLKGSDRGTKWTYFNTNENFTKLATFYPTSSSQVAHMQNTGELRVHYFK